MYMPLTDTTKMVNWGMEMLKVMSKHFALCDLAKLQ